MADMLTTPASDALLNSGYANPMGGIGGGKKAQSKEAVEKTAKEFESVFLAQMMQHMFEGVELDPMAADSEGSDVYQSWMIEQYGKIMADHGGIGIADHVKAEMLKLQEVKG